MPSTKQRGDETAVLAQPDPPRLTNGRAIAELAQLNFLRDDDHVLDVTVGPSAAFWNKCRPARLTTNDLDPAVVADHHYDGTALPFLNNAFDVVVWDPPYGYRGTSRLRSDERYGLSGAYRRADQIDTTLLAGTVEALRVARRLALIKSQDQNVSSRFRDQSGFVADEARRHGATVVAKLYLGRPRKQPPKRQLNVWGYMSIGARPPRDAPSELLVLEVGAA